MSFSADPVVRAEGLTVWQEHGHVLTDVDFEIDKGEFVYLIGRTGSGKSSLLKTLYADLPLGDGTAEVAGFRLRKLPRKQVPYLRRKLGIVFQDFQLFPDRTVADNLAFALRATGWRSKSRIRQRISEVLMRVGLGSVDARMPHQLSGGEQQRVAVARALLNEPILMLADEPTGNLDPEVGRGILQLFVDINRSGTAVLMATHNYDFLEIHPARVLTCLQGKLEDSARKGV